MFPIEDLGAGFYQVSDPSSLAQVFGRSGILGYLAFRAAKNMSFEPWIGSLSVGKLADMTLLGRNILNQKVPLRYASGSSRGVSIEKTWVGGEPIYVL